MSLLLYFLSPVQLRRGVIEQRLWWAPAVQPGSTHHSCLLWMFVPWTSPVLLLRQFSPIITSFGKNCSCTVSFCLLLKLIVTSFIQCPLAWLQSVNTRSPSPLSMPLVIFPLLLCPFQCFFSRWQSSNSVPTYMEANPHLWLSLLSVLNLFQFLDLFSPICPSRSK